MDSEKDEEKKRKEEEIKRMRSMRSRRIEVIVVMRSRWRIKWRKRRKHGKKNTKEK